MKFLEKGDASRLCYENGRGTLCVRILCKRERQTEKDVNCSAIKTLHSCGIEPSMLISSFYAGCRCCTPLCIPHLMLREMDIASVAMLANSTAR